MPPTTTMMISHDSRSTRYSLTPLSPAITSSRKTGTKTIVPISQRSILERKTFSIRYLDPFKKSPPWFLNPYNHPARHRAAFQIIQRPVEIAKFPPLDGNRLDFSCSGKRDDFFQFSQA